VAGEGEDKLKAAWESSKVEFRRHLTQTEPATWATIKSKAQQVAA
jgi:hypothetical protein